jgi:cytochrome c-type biogenesis protein CcmH/NrfG
MALATLDELGPARQALEKACRIGANPMAAKVLAAIYLGAFETERGLEMLRVAARLDPADFRPWYAMGESVHLRLRRYDDAAAAFREALNRAPDHLESRLGLVDALIKAHHEEETEPLLQGLLSDRPDDPKVLFLAAQLALEQGRDLDASRYLERTLALETDRVDTHLIQARLQFRRGLAREALSEAQRACLSDPDDLGALNLLSSIQMSLGLKEQSAETVARRRKVEDRRALMEKLILTIQESPDDPEPRWRLGRIAREAGMKPLAVQSYQAALALAPDCEQARQGLLDLGHPVAGVSAQPGKEFLRTPR